MRHTLLSIGAFNFIWYASRSIVSGCILNDALNGVARDDENQVTFWLTLTTIILSQIGLAATCTIFIHLMEWNIATRIVAVAAGAVVLMLDLLCLGFAVKQQTVGGDLGGRALYLFWSCIVAIVTNLSAVAIIFFINETEEEDEEEEEEYVNFGVDKGVA